MQVVCLYFPHLKLDLALASHPELRQRPVVLVDRPGPDGRVTSRSTAAALRGVLPAMRSRTARERAPDAVFLPDNGQRARELLASFASCVREEGIGVPEGGADYLAIHTGHFVSPDQVVAVAGIRRLPVAVKVGSGRSVPEALAAARGARAEWRTSAPPHRQAS